MLKVGKHNGSGRSPFMAWTIAVLFSLLLFSGCAPGTNKSSSQQTSKTGAGASQGSAAFVGYQLSRKKDFEQSLDFYATLVPILQADIRPKNSGWLTAVYVNTGDRVEKGDLLAEMDHVQLDRAVALGEAQLDSSEKILQSSRAAYRSAAANVLRQNAIVENDRLNAGREKKLLSQGYVSEQSYENTRTAYLSDKAALESLQAQLLAAQSQLASQKANVEGVQANFQIAKANLSDATLRAPFSGVVTQRNLDPGAFLSTAVTSTTTPVLSIADLKRLKVMVSVADTDVPEIRRDEEAQVTTDAYPGRIFQGRVTRIAQALDPDSRTLPVEVDIENPDESLKPGMYCHVRLISKAYPNAVVIPLNAIVFSGGNKSVWVLKDTPQGTTAERIPIETGAIQGADALVVKGLKGNEKIVTQGKENLKDGTQVKAQKVGEAQPGTLSAEPGASDAHGGASPEHLGLERAQGMRSVPRLHALRTDALVPRTTGCGWCAGDKRRRGQGS